MDAPDALPTALPSALSSMSPPGPRSSPRRAPTSPKRSLRESKFKRISPKSSTNSGRDTASPVKTSSKSTRSTQASARPLVPVTERMSHETKNRSKSKADTDPEAGDIAPDGGSAGREGRQFTVANVGNNGRIYLRPTVRPAHQRYPQPNFTFPVTPPGTASLDAVSQGNPGLDGDSDLHQSQWTPTPGPSPIPTDKRLGAPQFRPTPPTRHRRALSDSTIQDGTIANESDAGAFRIVISKPGEESHQRPKTTEDMNPDATPHLDIKIPSWRIGVPRFTSTGTPLIRGSSYAPSFAQSEDVQSVSASMFDRPQKDLNVMLPPLGPKRPSILKVPTARLSYSTSRLAPGLLSPKSPRTPKTPKSPNPLRSTFMSTRTVIDAPMYDDLTFKPACDDRMIVRYNASTGAVTAATPPRLVAEITSPSFLDYELISDFFLTFRAFLEPQQLLHMLIARLRWAVSRNDETGMIVHVRAFVALRHWILNYFMDDFVIDYDLRLEFCRLFNGFVEELAENYGAHKVQLKILNELKKCWRRVCAHYWDGPDLDDEASSDAPILPGGIAGHRDAELSPAFWERGKKPESHHLDRLVTVPETSVTSFRAEVSRAGHIGDSFIVHKRSMTPDNHPANVNEQDLGPMSPDSLASPDIISCSFPGKQLRNLQPMMGHPLAAHPVSSSSVYNQNGPVAVTPRALVGKRVRPNQQQRQRSGSLPESPEEHDANKVLFKDHEFTMASPHAGSLVRGDILPPGKAFVEMATTDRDRQTTIFESEDHTVVKQEAAVDAMSGRGMRRLIGSVRRALSARGNGTLSPQAMLFGTLPVEAASSTRTRLPGTAVVPQQPSSRDGARPPVRIDLLGAEVAEDFKRAVREDAAAEAAKFGLPALNQEAIPMEDTAGYSAAHMDATTFDSLPQNQRLRHMSEAGLTGGSQSIVIVDDTVPVGTSELHTHLSTANPSVEAFADTLLPNKANITPPMTPPLDHRELARRSSHLLNENIRNAMSSEPLPPFRPDLSTLGPHSTTPSESGKRVSHSGTLRSIRHPPPSRGLYSMHRRNNSSRTHRSINSVMHRRATSFSSDLMPPSTMQSLDATTHTRYSALEDDVDEDIPKPLRVLRRRPGGDLRAATNVDDLDRRVLRRSQSLVSLATFTESIRNSEAYSPRRNSIENLNPTIEGDFHGRLATFSVGQLAEKPSKRELSLCSTRSSKPVMRPSFEAEAKRLAQIPDDENDNGVESALLKLEGKFDPPGPKLSMDLRDRDAINSWHGSDSAEMTSAATSIIDQDRTSQDKAKKHRHFTVDDETCSVETSDIPPQKASMSSYLDIPRASTAGQHSFLSDVSRESYSSIPLLDRDLTDDGQSKRETKETENSRNWTDRSVLFEDEEDASPAPATAVYDDQHLSFDFIQKTESINSILPGETAPPNFEQESFLDSDISSELSADETQTEMHHHSHPPAIPDTLPTHSLGSTETNSSGRPSQPSIHNPGFGVPMDTGAGETTFHKDDLMLKPLPPTPEATPGAAFGPRSPFDLIGTTRPPFEPEGQETDASHKYSVHLPFVLAFDSEILAQQFTLIEKDALNEIDWKELVDMDWRNAKNHNSRSWVDFLRNTEAQGVEVVIARFNLMVKWVVSEIVLTQHIEERARCLIKYIHIAGHCRRFRNFATLAQLTIALSSNEVSRLARTWELVPPKDMKTLRDLENLVTPMRNFYNLRAEMESGPDVGCIPFVGIYTHDLLYNAQRPSEIASSPTTPPLVNFERCRIGAAVVKTLLRLLEASSRFDFQPIEGVTERCLWIGALGDDEIRRHSGNLE